MSDECAVGHVAGGAVLSVLLVMWPDGQGLSSSAHGCGSSPMRARGSNQRTKKEIVSSNISDHCVRWCAVSGALSLSIVNSIPSSKRLC